MKLAVLGDGRPGLAAVQPDGSAIAGEFADVGEWNAAGRPEIEGAGESAGASFAAPVRPGKVVAIGLNYADHIRESGLDTPGEPLIFAKFPSSVIGPGEAIELPDIAEARVDWEVELGVVIGSRARNVSAAEALDHVLGYVVANDVSARAVQFGDGQWVRGKSFDTFCPVGPVILTADEVADPQALSLKTMVNGETVQDSSTAEMIFGVAELIAYCSRQFSFEPGDLLLTGTPWGCGEFMEPRRSLQAGDVVRCEIPEIGAIENEVRSVNGSGPGGQR